MTNKKQLNVKNLAVLSASSIALSCTFGASAAYIMDWPTVWCIAATNLASSSYFLRSVNDRIRNELGLNSATQIAGNWTRKAFGREIPINAGDNQSSIFMQVLPLLGAGNSAEQSQIAELETITIWYNENNHTVLIPDLEEFIYTAWRRQRQNKPGFSRRYWTEQRRPIINKTDYESMMKILVSIDGLIINRSASRSGKLTLPPLEALKKIKATF